ncbi:MAG TPA: SMC-Scp complex subunit ScpB [Candidatus Bathyarchaeia archaeon]|nr:SMC-Scp complex subunit ScpB [Candidatus Bathyarchaeia archaeon]
MSETESQETEIGKSQDKVSLIEAALYVAGKPLDLKTLGSVIGIRSEEKTRETARKLKDRYIHDGRAIEVLELTDGRFVMQLRPQYAPHVRRLATRQLLTPGPMKTLSFIAYKQPITQSYLAKVRGNLSYSHVKHLQEMGLISEEKLGRTKVLRTTPNFADYFNLSQDLQTMKKQLEKIFEEIKVEKYPNKQVITGGSLENGNFSSKLEDGSSTG